MEKLIETVTTLKIHDHIVQETNLNYGPPVQKLLRDYLGLSDSDYVYHTKVFLNYDEEDAYIFILKTGVILTTPFNEEKVTEEDQHLLILQEQFEFFNETFESMQIRKKTKHINKEYLLLSNPVLLEMKFEQIYRICLNCKEDQDDGNSLIIEGYQKDNLTKEEI